MKICLKTLAISILLAGCTGQEPPAATGFEPDTPASAQELAELTVKANAAVKALAGSLTAQLQAALQTGGPVNGLEVCHTVAPAISESVSHDHGMTVTRVSLRNRNPVMGLPNDWQRQVLHEFESRKAAGEDPGSLTYAEIVAAEFRFMKAIPTAPLCLNCHGSQLDPALTAKLAELYPADRAVGYRQGDLRGAFVVTRSLARQ